MNTKPNDGGPAFPRATTLHPITSYPWNDEQQGMSLRDWLAGMAMQGIVASYGFASFPAKTDIAKDSYELSDAMLTEKDKLP